MVDRKIWVPKSQPKELSMKQVLSYSQYQGDRGSASSSSSAVKYRNSGLYSQTVRGERRGNVPRWEKDFCFSESKIKWKTICDAKIILPYHKKVAQWDDSACKEAFLNSKHRYWAKINNLPCDIPQPDPDMYLDEVDWDTQIDPDLHIGLDDAKIYVEPSNHSPSFLKGCLNPPTATGWGDEDSPAATGWGDKVPLAVTGWGDEVPLDGTGWGDEVPLDGTGWGDEVPPAIGWGDEVPPAATGWGDEIPPAATGWGDEVPPAATGWGDEVPPAATGWGDEVPFAATGLEQEYTPAVNRWRRGGGRNHWRIKSTNHSLSFFKGCLNPPTATGWGDEDSPAATGWGDKAPPAVTGWGDEVSPDGTGWGDEVPPAVTGWVDEVPPAATGWGDEVPPAATGLEQEYTPAVNRWRRGGGRNHWRIKSTNHSPSFFKGCLNPPTTTGWGDEDSPAATGWGDKAPPAVTGWGDEAPPDGTGWGDEVPPAATGWGDEVPPAATGWGDEVPPTATGWGDEVPPDATGWGDEVPFAATGLEQEYTPAVNRWRRGGGRNHWRIKSRRKKADDSCREHREKNISHVNRGRSRGGNNWSNPRSIV